MAGINGGYASSLYTANSRKTEKQDDPVSVAARQSGDSVAVSGEAQKLLAQQRAEKAFAGAPATFEEMEEGLGEKQREVADIMNEAREVSGYEGRIVATPVGVLYTVGPYAKHCSETGQWQWYNQDGTLRNDRPSAEEFDEQMRISEENLKKHSAYLMENNFFEKFRELARDATLLDFGKNEDGFRDDYLSDSAETIRKNAEMLLRGYEGYSYVSENAGDPGIFKYPARTAT